MQGPQSVFGLNKLGNPNPLRMAKTLWSFGHFECSRVNQPNSYTAEVLTKDTGAIQGLLIDRDL